MIAKKIALSDFRNVERCEVTFDPGVNVLYGSNAQGKTNLLEAVYYAAIGKSFRGQKTQELLRFGAQSGFLSLDFEGAGRAQNISVRLYHNRVRTVEKNRVPVARMSEIVGTFRAVLFCPEHLALIKEGPAERRQFLDIAVSALEPVYLATLQRYGQVLKERNALLRAAEEHPAAFRETAEVWSRRLAAEGAVLARSRARYVARAEKYVVSVFAEMTGTAEVPRLVYKGPVKDPDHDYEDLAATEEACFKLLTAATEREVAAGATLWGAHRDDVEVYLNGREARLYASQGQQRSLALALKLAEGEIIRDDCGEYPVFLFDDVLSELDAARRAYLLGKIGGKQVILTACEQLQDTPAHTVRVENGNFYAE